MKKLIEKTFEEFFNQKVRVINLPDDEIDMAIYVVHDKKFEKMSERQLATFGFDFAITRTNGEQKNNWVYMVSNHHEAIIRNNEVISPPDYEIYESVEIFLSSENALEGLILSIVKEKFSEIKMDVEMEENYEKL